MCVIRHCVMIELLCMHPVRRARASVGYDRGRKQKQ
jgi:hypothetical protein